MPAQLRALACSPKRLRVVLPAGFNLYPVLSIDLHIYQSLYLLLYLLFIHLPLYLFISLFLYLFN